ncbi:MAG: hypothetical protein GC179_15355 [Anaerolineaceae bacterium]|nr:hypothetical protein [Anaerolineaceae bacterium]
MKAALSLLLTMLLLGFSITQAQDTTTSTTNDDGYMRSLRLGINHISGVEEVTSPARYQKALELGAGWNRWPIYWDRVETKEGVFDWSGYDRLVTDDLAQGLGIDAILLGRPAFYADDNRIKGLQEPIFADSSDTPSQSKKLNPKNHWVNFVQKAVLRYMPNGELAREKGWSKDKGIRIWEIWNEPDFQPFWSSSIIDYARLLKSAYIVIKQVDPNAQVMFAGLLFGTNDNWLARVLAIYQDDPFHEAYNWYMDMVAVHNYSYPWRSGWLVNVVDQTLIAYKLKRPIWLNESGVPVWDDYPGPLWANTPVEKELRATSQQQADFFVQSAAYAYAEGASVVFFHQLFDDCGNQPAGTDFTYHITPTCPGAICSGDAFGLFRNEVGSVCFSHHPKAGTARPAAGAYQLVADVFGTGELDKPKITVIDNRATLITFDRPKTNQRLYIVWNNTLDTLTVKLPVGKDALDVRTLNAQYRLTPDKKGFLELDLPAADCDYFPFLQSTDITGIGGSPIILIGKLPDKPVTVDKTAVPTLVPPITTPRTRCARVDEVVKPK